MSQRKRSAVSKSPEPVSRRAATPRAERAAAWADSRDAVVQTQYFSTNPDKAWAEIFFLKYSVAWIVMFGSWAVSGYHRKTGDFVNLFVTLLIMAPSIVVPLFASPSEKPIVEQYWFKFLLWIAIFTFVASYFFSEYFFAVLGMKYNFTHLHWTFDSILVGNNLQRVPIMMYFHAFYFFITYHTGAIIVMRAARTSPLLRGYPVFGMCLSTFAAAFFFSWAEIRFTTMEAIDDLFAYGDMNWALSWGALGYSCYFISSFPFVQYMDETTDNIWDLRRTIETSLAAGMVAFIILDLSCQFIIPLDSWYERVWWPHTLVAGKK